MTNLTLPNPIVGSVYQDVVDRIFNRVKETPGNLSTPCWEFEGAKDIQGYGAIGCHGKKRNAHRIVFLHFGGNPKLDAHHKCDNPPCCNPDHLEGLTRKQHARATPNHAINHPKTHCIKGHEFTAENTRFSMKRGVRVKICRACNKITRKIYNATKRIKKNRRCSLTVKRGQSSYGVSITPIYSNFKRTLA